MTTDKIGVYVHVPYCVRKCSYCDFCSFPLNRAPDRRAYIDALLSEMDLYRERDLTVDTVFFGGGTPSLLTPDELDGILAHIREVFHVTPDAEMTLEANPGTVTRESMRRAIAAGVNRISLGLQSIHENEMKILGRIHNYDDFLAAYNTVRELGIDNVNVDLMYAIPSQTVESLSETVDRVLSLSPEHVSLYSLILEEGTPLYEMRETLELPDEDAEIAMYSLVTDKLRRAGYTHYEISNYARAGRESRHNLRYWQGGRYLGFGLSAYSYFDGERFGNTSDPSLYLSGKGIATDREIIDLEREAYEYVMLGLRLGEGISLRDYSTRFGSDFLDGRRDSIDSLIGMGYATLDGDRLKLTERGFYVNNAILTELI
jgi:oxygen-independent coproporphyrinogen-3 oxidase